MSREGEKFQLENSK